MSPPATAGSRNANGMIVEEGIAQNEKRLYLLLFEILERVIDVTFCHGPNEHELHRHGARRFLRFAYLHLCIGIFRVHKRGKYPRIGNKLMQQLKTLRCKQIAEE